MHFRLDKKLGNYMALHSKILMSHHSNSLKARLNVVNVLGGKEWTVGSKKNNVVGLSGRLNLKGGSRTTPADLVASQAKKEVVYDESRAFLEQYPGYYRFDLSATYRKNMAGYSVVFVAQINNLFSSPTTVNTDFNYSKNTVEVNSYGEPFPNISCKLEF